MKNKGYLFEGLQQIVHRRLLRQATLEKRDRPRT